MSEQLRVFVGGPIQYLLQAENSGSVICSHREIISALRDAGCTILSAHEAEAYGELSSMFSPAEVTERDYAWAAACDVYVALLPTDKRGIPYRTDGTHVEIGWATALGKRVILVLDETPNRPYGHLVLGLIANGHAIGVSMSAWRESLLPLVLKGGPSSPLARKR